MKFLTKFLQRKEAIMNDKKISISDIRDLNYIADHLKGEEAVEEIIRLIDYPDDNYAQDDALKAVVRFYSNVRYLVSQMNQVFNKQ